MLKNRGRWRDQHYHVRPIIHHVTSRRRFFFCPASFVEQALFNAVRHGMASVTGNPGEVDFVSGEPLPVFCEGDTSSGGTQPQPLQGNSRKKTSQREVTRAQAPA